MLFHGVAPQPLGPHLPERTHEAKGLPWIILVALLTGTMNSHQISKSLLKDSVKIPHSPPDLGNGQCHWRPNTAGGHGWCGRQGGDNSLRDMAPACEGVAENEVRSRVGLANLASETGAPPCRNPGTLAQKCTQASASPHAPVPALLSSQGFCL